MLYPSELLTTSAPCPSIHSMPAAQLSSSTSVSLRMSSVFPRMKSAFDADFILGKTEDIRSETEVEEDNWAAGIEWMEGQGADVVSSSLGYNIFDDGNGYTWANGDFNGRTSVTAKAAVRAARLG